MERPTVIGVRRPPAPARDATVEATVGSATERHEPRLGWEAVQFASFCTAALLAAIVWQKHGAIGPELVLLVPFWFVFTPLLAFWAGHGVVWWDRAGCSFEAFADDASTWRAKLMLVADGVLSIAVPVLLLCYDMPRGGC